MSLSDLEHPANIFLTPDQVAERYQVKRTTIDRWTKDEVLPKPIRLNNKRPRWRLVDLQDWEARLEQTDGVRR